MTPPLLSLRSVSKLFRRGDYEVRAVDDITLDVAEGECLAIVGESGSGKSTLANLILGTFPPSIGSIELRGEPLPVRRSLAHRRAIQYVQQNPYSSLNPKRTIGASLRLALDVHGIGKRHDRNAHVGQLLAEVGLDEAVSSRLPPSLSGGQRQRVAIARALACGSDLVVLDEPTSALDVLVQARVLRLLDELRRRRGLTFIFITHELSVVRNFADRLAVLEKGKLVEVAEIECAFSAPVHPYSRKLLGAVPVVGAAEIELRNRLRSADPPRNTAAP